MNGYLDIGASVVVGGDEVAGTVVGVESAVGEPFGSCLGSAGRGGDFSLLNGSVDGLLERAGDFSAEAWGGVVGVGEVVLSGSENGDEFVSYVYFDGGLFSSVFDVVVEGYFVYKGGLSVFVESCVGILLSSVVASEVAFAGVDDGDVGDGVVGDGDGDGGLGSGADGGWGESGEEREGGGEAVLSVLVAEAGVFDGDVGDEVLDVEGYEHVAGVDVVFCFGEEGAFEFEAGDVFVFVVKFYGVESRIGKEFEVSFS